MSTIAAAAAAKPVPTAERLHLLDAMRGFALLGIMFVNMTWFTGFAVLSGAEREVLGTRAIDGVTAWVVHFAVDSKFWSLFALLFGVGFAIQIRRADDDGLFVPRFVRRMAILLVIGALHAIFVWFGDIVSIYAVTGIWLLLFRRCGDRALVGWALALLASPVVLVAGRLAIDVATRAGAPRVDPGHGPAELLVLFATGTYAEALRANWAFLVERWIIAFESGRFLTVLGMFLVGLLAVRRGLLDAPADHRRLLRRVLGWGLLIGVPANLLLASTQVPLRPPSAAGTLMTAVAAVGIPALCLAYAAGLTLASDHRLVRRAMTPFAITGRMTLTNYFAQSLIGVAIFYGYGFGLSGKIGITASIGVIAAIFAAQIAGSALWLRHFERGPLEWLWRCAIYGRRLPSRRERGPSGSPVLPDHASLPG